jgi:hypothetical protein
MLTFGTWHSHLQLLAVRPRARTGYLGISDEEELQLKLVLLDAASDGDSASGATAAAAALLTTGHMVNAAVLAELDFPAGCESGNV